MSPSRKRRAVAHLQAEFEVSERRACNTVGQPRSTQRRRPNKADKEAGLLREIRELARKYPRFGYRRTTQVLRRRGWAINTKRVQRLRRQHGLQVRQQQKKQRSLGHSDNGCSRHRPEHAHHVWSLDFVSDQTDDGRRLKILAVIDEYTRQCLAIRAGRSIKSADVIDVLEELVLTHKAPDHLRSDNGPEFIAYAIQDFLATREVGPLYIAPGAPWENGYIESFNARFRDELLDREVFGNLREAQALIEAWRRHYNEERPHSALGYATPAEFAAQTEPQAFWPVRQLKLAS